MDQHFATHADVERMCADLVDRMGQLEVRLVDRVGDLETRMEQRLTIQTRGIAGLFVGQTLVMLGAVFGMARVLS